MEAYHLRDHAEQVLATPTDADHLKKHEEAAAHAKRLIMDGVKDHIVPHIVEKKTTNEMWKALTTLYEGKLRSFMMTKGEEIEPFLFKLQTIRDQFSATRAKVEDDVMVMTAPNAVTEEWETFVQSVLGRADLLTGTICGKSFVKKNSTDSPRSSTTRGQVR